MIQTHTHTNTQTHTDRHTNTQTRTNFPTIAQGTELPTVWPLNPKP